MLLMRVYDPDPKSKLLAKALSEVNILKRGLMHGKLSDKIVLDALDKIERLLRKLEEQ